MITHTNYDMGIAKFLGSLTTLYILKTKKGIAKVTELTTLYMKMITGALNEYQENFPLIYKENDRGIIQIVRTLNTNCIYIQMSMGRKIPVG